MHKLTLKSLFIVFCLASSSSFAWDNFKDYLQDRWQFDADLNYYNATGNYSSGTVQNLLGGYSYHVVNTDLRARYTSAKVGFYAGTDFAYSTSDDTVTTRTNSGATDAFVGMDFLMIHRGTFKLIPDISILIPFQKVDTTVDKTLISDGDMEINAKLLLQKDFSFMRDFFFVGYTYRSTGLSALFKYGIGAETKFSPVHFIGVDLDGFSSASSDQYTSNSFTRNGYAAAKDGGSLKFYSVNPSMLETHLWYRFANNEDFSVKVTGGSTINGSNYGAGWDATVGAEYWFQDNVLARKKRIGGQQPPAPSAQQRPQLKKQSPTFQEDVNDDVNQKLFQPQNEDLKQDLNNTEKQIENRGK